MRRANRLFLAAVVVVCACAVVYGQTTAFTYQGSLKDNAVPANANYDFEFALFDAPSGGSQLGVTIAKNAVLVTNGIFAVNLDFGNQFPGANRYLEIRVKMTGQANLTTLTPRQQVNSSPYSLKSLTAENATNATTATNAIQLGGTAANQYVLTGDARLSDARNPLPGSASYIQNGTTTQLSSNFNISGNGTAAGTLAGNFVVATDSFAMSDGGPILYTRRPSNNSSNPPTNIFAGVIAGPSSLQGEENSVYGYSSAFSLTGGNSNSFFGSRSGFANSLGSNNSFFGRNAGTINTTGSNNSVFGASADFSANNLTNATAIGSNSFVSQSNSLVLGSINGVNGSVVDTNVGIGTTAPTVRLHVVGDGLFTGNVTANGTFSTPILNAATQFNIGGTRVFGVGGNAQPYLYSNTYVGQDSGTANPTTGGGTYNSFFGAGSGKTNTTGSENSFFGTLSGSANTSGTGNSFFGDLAGSSNTTAGNGSFFGSGAGFSNTAGTTNTFIGQQSGNNNTIGSYNAFFGSRSGITNVNGFNNTIIGTNADVASGNLTNATAIGANALAGKNNVVVLGSINGVNGATEGTNVGIGTTMPSQRLHVVGNGLFAGDITTSGKLGIGSASPGPRLYVGSGSDGQSGPVEAIRIQGPNSPADSNSAQDLTWSFASAGSATIRSYRGQIWDTYMQFITTPLNSNTPTVRMQIDPSGLVTIPSPGGLLIGNNATIPSSGQISFAGPVTIGNGGLQIINLSGGSGGSPLCAAGSAPFTVGFCSSSLRYKTNIAGFHSGLGLIGRLHPITYDWKQGGSHDIGLGAEDVEKVDKRLVFYNEKGQVEGVRYDRLPVVLINAVKEQQALIEVQQREIDSLKRLVCMTHRKAAVCRRKTDAAKRNVK
jgi:hypothetical protein